MLTVLRTQLSCSAHLLANILRKQSTDSDGDPTNNIASDIETVRKAMVDVSGSPTLLVMFHESQKALGVKESNPVIDVSTRFGSTFHMLQYYIESFYKPMVRCCVNGAFDNNNSDITLLTPVRFGVLEKIVEMSKPVVDMITVLVNASFLLVVFRINFGLHHRKASIMLRSPYLYRGTVCAGNGCKTNPAIREKSRGTKPACLIK